MIITKTPLRISFIGGGTDIESFYKNHGGFVVSTAINKYIYVLVNERFDDDIRVSYSKTEVVSNVGDLEHGIIRECLKEVGITKGIEIVTVADVPSRGTGLGSSSALTVGLLKALYEYQGMFISTRDLSELAAKIEIVNLGSPIGKQDHYIAAFGGFRGFHFGNDGHVKVFPNLSTNVAKEIGENLMLYYTGMTRSATTILMNMDRNSKNNERDLLQLKGMAEILYQNIIEENPNIGKALEESWHIKRRLDESITNINIDKMYYKALSKGATGGKICGAGGGGFLLLYVPRNRQDDVREVLSDYKELRFKLNMDGSGVEYL